MLTYVSSQAGKEAEAVAGVEAVTSVAGGAEEGAPVDTVVDRTE
jgi:hypothetical protein